MAVDPRMAAFEANLTAVATVGRGHPWADIHDDSDVTWVVSDIPFGWANAVIRVRFDATRADERIAGILARFRERRRRMRWWLLPGSTPHDLAERVVAHGLVTEHDDPAMALELTGWTPEPMPSDVTVERITDAAGFHLWVTTFALAFETTRGIEDDVFERCWADVAVGDASPIAAYLARLDGVPVATAFARVHDGVVGVYAVGTMPAARRRGVGTAVTARMLLDAREAGARLAVLSASVMGEPVYARMGFERMGRSQTAVGRFDLEG